MAEWLDADGCGGGVGSESERGDGESECSRRGLGLLSTYPYTIQDMHLDAFAPLPLEVCAPPPPQPTLQRESAYRTLGDIHASRRNHLQHISRAHTQTDTHRRMYVCVCARVRDGCTHGCARFCMRETTGTSTITDTCTILPGYLLPVSLCLAISVAYSDLS